MNPRSVNIALRRRRTAASPDPGREPLPVPPVPTGWLASRPPETADATDPHLDDLAALTAELGDPRAAAMRIAVRRPRFRP